ncbi:xanthine dehydrogenase family protein subunit M (plasmid) [Tistrella mobilis]|uniref:FAD binding domain-containing protein n=1 Tax=Tistrella mobilis TaxID=171437 RepID=UPI003556F861
MKPGSFEYVKADTVEAAIEALQRFDGEARILAGGQSLMPLLNMRMLRPAGLIDVNGISDLSGIRVEAGEVRVGALTRYVDIEQSPLIARHLPLVAHGIRKVADRQVRNRGTLGGSLCHADPAAQMPLCALTMDARLRLAGPDGLREVPARAFFLGAYATAADPLEILVDIIYPDAEGTLGTIAQQIRRHGDFPAVSIAASARPADDGRWVDWRIGACGLDDRAIRLDRTAAMLEGQRPDAEVIAAAAAALLEDDIDPPEDVRASAEYRRHLAPIYVARAVTALVEEARP